VEIEKIETPVEPPRGIYPARVDEKGRLKLPVNFQAFLSASGEQKVYITSLDYTTARIYPISLWKQNEKILNESTDDPNAAEDIAFAANVLGADAELDGQGRLLLPTDLRRELSLEAQPVWLECYQGGINIYNEGVYEARKKRSRERLDEKLLAFKKKGFK
jgi:MraZ protein